MIFCRSNLRAGRKPSPGQPQRGLGRIEAAGLGAAVAPGAAEPTGGELGAAKGALGGGLCAARGGDPGGALGCWTVSGGRGFWDWFFGGEGGVGVSGAGMWGMDGMGGGRG